MRAEGRNRAPSGLRQPVDPVDAVPDRTPVAAHHVLSVLVLGLLLAAPLILVVAPLDRQSALRGDPVTILLAAGVVAYSAAHLAVFCWRARARWAEAFFWAFSYVWLGLASLAQVSSALNPLSTAFDARTQQVALGVVLLGFCAFDVGARLVRRRAEPRSGAVHIGPDARRVLSRPRVIALGVLAVGLTPVFVIALGGPTALFGSRLAVTAHLMDSAFYTDTSHVLGGLLTSAANVLPFVAGLAVLCLLRAREHGRREPALWWLLGALVVANLVLNNPISNPRNWFLAVAIAGLLALGWTRRPVAKVALVVAFVAGATVVFPYADAFRTNDVGVQNTTRTASTPVDFLIGKTDYGAVTDIAVTVRHVERVGHTDGRQLLGALTFWVPRSLWPDKPTNTAEILAAEIDFPNPNLDTPLWAEGYIDFGPVGTALVLAAFGALARRVDDAVERAETDPGRHLDVVYPIAVSFVGYESFLLRGSLLQAMAKIVTVVVVLLLLGRQPGGWRRVPLRRLARRGR